MRCFTLALDALHKYLIPRHTALFWGCCSIIHTNSVVRISGAAIDGLMACAGRVCLTFAFRALQKNLSPRGGLLAGTGSLTSCIVAGGISGVSITGFTITFANCFLILAKEFIMLKLRVKASFCSHSSLHSLSDGFHALNSLPQYWQRLTVVCSTLCM